MTVPRITWLGHSTVVLDLDGVRLLTDPVLRRHVGPLRRRGPAPDAHSWRGSDAVLLSHAHYDHADLPSLRLVDGVDVLSTLATAAWLRAHNLPNARGLAPAQWDDVGVVRLRLVEAVHRSRPLPNRPTDACGQLIVGPSATIWVAGDTELFEDMSLLPELAGRPIDLAVVPIGGWGPRLSPGHLGPEQAAVACARVGARYALPVHWGTFHLAGAQHLPPGWMDRPAALFTDALARLAPHCTPLLLDTGASVTISSAA